MKDGVVINIHAMDLILDAMMLADMGGSEILHVQKVRVNRVVD